MKKKDGIKVFVISIREIQKVINIVKEQKNKIIKLDTI